MEATLYLNTTTKAISATITGCGLPTVSPRLQAHLKLRCYFFAEGDEDPSLLAGTPTWRVAFKNKTTPSGDVLALKSSVTTTGADYYEFEWDTLDSSALRTLIGDAETCDTVLEIETTDDDDEVEKYQMPVTITNAWLRTADTAPDPTADAIEAFLTARCVRFDTAQTLTGTQIDQALTNLGITNIRSATITAGGYLQLTNDAGDAFHIGLNSGSAPS